MPRFYISIRDKEGGQKGLSGRELPIRESDWKQSAGVGLCRPATTPASL